MHGVMAPHIRYDEVGFDGRRLDYNPENDDEYLLFG